MRAVTRFVRDQRGSALIEFALVSPMVIMLILGALEFGRVLQSNAGLRELAGWAGRQAVISYQIVGDGVVGADALKTNIRTEAARAKYNLSAGTLGVTVNVNDITTLPTVQRVNVALTYNHTVSMPFLQGKTINLSVNRAYFVPHPGTNDF